MLNFSKRQAQAPLLMDRQALVEDLDEWLSERLPSAMAAVPQGTRWSLHNETARLCFRLQIYDVEHLRFLAEMRWTMAPGFYREPRLWAVLADTARPEHERMDALAAPALGEAWDAAVAVADPAHWQDLAQDLVR